MKKKKLLALLENAEKSFQNVTDDSFYEGHKFVEYGKNIPNVSLVKFRGDIEANKLTLDKDSLVITWGAKFNFRNSGIDGIEVAVLNLEGKINGQVENFAEYKFNVLKERNPEEFDDLKIYVESVEVDVEHRMVNVIVSI